MEINVELIKAAGLQCFNDIIDPHYLLEITNALKRRLEGGSGLTSLRLWGKVSILNLMYPITYIHLFKLSWWVGFLSAEKIRFVSEKYQASSILLDAKAVEKMLVWIECSKTFLEDFILECPDKKMKHLPWNEETVRRSTSDQIRAVVAMSGHFPTRMRLEDILAADQDEWEWVISPDM